MTGSRPKKVILTIIDSLNPQALESCFRRGLVPALQFLKEKGQYYSRCVSVFPTMTPTATSSIVTGTGPDFHQVPGFVWFSRREKRFINYGASFGAIWKLGLPTVIEDLLFNLNIKQLSKKVRTIYEILEDHGWSTAAINFYIFRGRNVFETKIPLLMQMLTRFKLIGRLMGPKLLVLGELCRPARLFKDAKLWAPVGPFYRFGVNDEFSGIISSYLIKEGKQPDLMLIYLPDTDSYAHRHKPTEIEESLIKADRQVERVLNAYSSWDKALEENVFLVAGDHSQSLVQGGEGSIIDLRALLAEFRQASLGRLAIQKDIAICPNERMSYVYILRWREHRQAAIKQRVIELLREDRRIDQIMWKEKSSGLDKYVISRGDSRLWFTRGGGGIDEYGQRWHWEGDLAAVDGYVEENSLKLVFRDYPDSFNRISSLLDCSQAGDVICTAKPGCEFDGEGAPIHPGTGSHGSLHWEDSCVPLIIAGTEQKLEQPRIVDFVPFILKHFGVKLPDYLKR
ncbi:MAG: alkaline phosphatase family protein [Clostridia bacterium]|nr:alkaline phosphatase family protein [Clostridia bacterium]